LFWGKITGINADYYIALGVDYRNHYEFPEKRFFYALSNNFVSFKIFKANEILTFSLVIQTIPCFE